MNQGKRRMREIVIDYFLKFHHWFGLYNFFYLQKNVIELNNLEELKKIYNWKNKPLLDRKDIFDFNHVEDVNERRVRDAEVLAAVMINSNPKIALEIGTADGGGTTLMSVNAPNSIIYTVNIPPEEIIAGKGGKLTTVALERDKIGKVFRDRKLNNIEQIYANTKNWVPNFGKIEVAFIDGCHDTNFVYNDTLKVLKNMKIGSFILWHDFNIDMSRKFYWIYCVCKAIERLYKRGYLKGEMYHVKDSWIGIYQVK